MNSQIYLAHLAKDGRRQTLLEHAEGTSRRSSDFAADFGASQQGCLVGLAHDLGKYSAAFQRRLLENGPKVDHSTAGAFECWQKKQPFAAFAIAGHHGGLPDGGGRGDGPEAGTFFSRINKGAKGRLENYAAWQGELSLPEAALPEYAQKDKLAGMFFTRMLFSCLVDADYTDTGEFMEGQVQETEDKADIEELWNRLQKYISPWFPPKGELNAKRSAILEQCMREGERRAPGLYTLTVPTGGGKTVASLAFALAQARAQGMKRVVYVIPYTSIIEQTSDIFRKILGSSNVLEHHSGILFEPEKEEDSTPENRRLTQAAETWDMPVVVTTAVQFFESLFSCKPAQCRKLHNLAKSVLIFDEAQMLPLSFLRPCVWAMTQLLQHYGASVILCTATQPALAPLFRSFAPDLIPAELCPMPTEDWDVFRRVTFRQAGKLTWEELTEQLQAQNQVLCIVNTRKAALEIFQQLAGQGNFHLSTLMYPQHRRAVLEEIRRRLEKGLPCRVISTSLIEAGVDVDFPAVYRDEAGLDSLIQAAGRCNREGRRPLYQRIVTLFQGQVKPPRLFETAIGAGRGVLDKFKDIASREAIQAYFRELLELKGTQAQDTNHILSLMETEFFPFRTVSEQFHLIETPTITIYIPVDEGANLVECLQSGQITQNLYRKLGQYGVSVYPQHFRELEQAGALKKLEDGSFVLEDLSLYKEETGLSLEADSGKAWFI